MHEKWVVHALEHRIKYYERVLQDIAKAVDEDNKKEIYYLCHWALGRDIPYRLPEWLLDVRQEIEEQKMWGMDK